MVLYLVLTKEDEDYCRRFLVAFSAYRAENDLKRANSYKRRLIDLYQKNVFQDYLEIADNIQNIRNSLDAGSMTDTFKSDDVDPDDEEEVDENGKGNLDLQEQIAAFFQQETRGDVCKEEPCHFEFTVPEISNHSSDNNVDEMEKVIEVDTTRKVGNNESPKHKNRFVASVQCLNGLV